MKCEDVVAWARNGESALADEAERRQVAEHIAGCEECQDAMRGAEAVDVVRRQSAAAPEPELFGRLMAVATAQDTTAGAYRNGFWLGTGLGAAAAAAVFAAVLMFGTPQETEVPTHDTAAFYVSTGEARNLNIAIDAETPLRDATVSLTLYGGVELAGYGNQRHLTWTSDLDAGVNRLSLPVIAVNERGGQIIVRLDHPDSQQEFLVALRHES